MKTIPSVEKLFRQQAALAHFGSFAFHEPDLQNILNEAVRTCAQSLGVPFSKICRYRPEENDLLVVAGHGWNAGVVGHVISEANGNSTQGRAFITGEPVILKNIQENESYILPAFYADHGIVSTADVLIKGTNGPFGVLEVDCSTQYTFDHHDINFLTGFANVVAEAIQASERTEMLNATLAELKLAIEAKEFLLEEKSLLALIAEHTKDIIIITDRLGAIEWVNPPFESSTGYRLADVRGKKPGSFLQGPGTDPKAITDMREAMAAGQPIHLKVLNYKKEGQPYWSAISIYPIKNKAGELVRFVASERDITQDQEDDDKMAMHRDSLEGIVEEKSLPQKTMPRNPTARRYYSIRCLTTCQ